MVQSKQPIDFRERSQHQSVLGIEIDELVKGIKKYQKAKFKFWEEVVGEKIAGVAVPVKNKKGVLFVKVEDSVWRFELTRRKEEILVKVNEHSNKNSIKDIVFI
jgi:predicted nucleic acid-binding Zn ribbon protein